MHLFLRIVLLRTIRMVCHCYISIQCNHLSQSVLHFVPDFCPTLLCHFFPGSMPKLNVDPTWFGFGFGSGFRSGSGSETLILTHFYILSLFDNYQKRAVYSMNVTTKHSSTKTWINPHFANWDYCLRFFIIIFVLKTASNIFVQVMIVLDFLENNSFVKRVQRNLCKILEYLKEVKCR
jgi:hypothetical protein